MIPPEIRSLVDALQPIKVYLPNIVLIGGWVPLLNKIYNPSYNFDGAPVLTKDVDIACPQTLPVKEEAVDELLMKSGFKSQLLGSDKPPICKYINDSGVELEFLTPMKGSGSASNVNVQGGLSAQSLRYLEILLEHTVFIEITEVDLKIQTPELTAFLYQKGLSFPLRNSELKKAKDLYYIYQVLDSADLENLVQNIKRKIFPGHPSPWVKTFINNLTSQFGKIDSIGVDSVFRQLKDLPEYRGDEPFEKMKIFGTVSEFIGRLKT